MAKLILVVAGFMIAWWILKGYRRRVDRRDAERTPPEAESMVQCAQCGVHLPRSEGLLTKGLYYCSADHRRQHESRKDAG